MASYRRIDVRPTTTSPPLVQAALVSTEEPGEQVSAPKALMAALAPVVERFSDTILLSNLGRHPVAGVSRLDFFPVARGRSAVCFASAAIEGGETTLTLRARDLSPGDARRLLDGAPVAHLADDPDLSGYPSRRRTSPAAPRGELDGCARSGPCCSTTPATSPAAGWGSTSSSSCPAT